MLSTLISTAEFICEFGKGRRTCLVLRLFPMLLDGETTFGAISHGQSPSRYMTVYTQHHITFVGNAAIGVRVNNMSVGTAVCGTGQPCHIENCKRAHNHSLLKLL